VTVPARFGDDELERVVRLSFEFLLKREPASSIMREFSLDVIQRYFPEYEDELPFRLAEPAAFEADDAHTGPGG
jgi:hypothetical protein